MRKQAGNTEDSTGSEAATLPIRRQPRDPVTGQYLPCAPGEIPDHTTTGLRAQRVPEAFLDLQRAFVAGAVTDEGDRPEDIPTRRRSLIEYRSLLHRKIAQLDHAFREGGLFDKKGKLRVAWLQQLTALIGRAESTDRLLGLERRSRQIDPDDVGTYIAQREHEIERQ